MRKILSSVKEAVDLGIDGDDTFDKRLLMEIDGVLSELAQMTSIDTEVDVDEDTTYEDVLQNSDKTLVRMIERYITLSVRLMFDPPTGSVLQSLKDSKLEAANRITMHSATYNNVSK